MQIVGGEPGVDEHRVGGEITRWVGVAGRAGEPQDRHDAPGTPQLQGRGPEPAPARDEQDLGACPVQDGPQ